MPAFKRSVIYCVSFICAFLCNVAFDLACGPEPDPYDYYVSFFHNSVQKNDAYWSFYFNGYTFLNDDQEQVSEADVNVSEWAAYMGSSATAQDIDQVLYHFNHKQDSLCFRNLLDLQYHLPDSLKKNTFLKALARKPYVDANSTLPYLANVKRTEPMISREYDQKWNPQPFNKNELHAFGVRYLKRGTNQSDQFLKLRYFYQAQRLLHYGGSYQEASDIYDKYIKEYPSASHVKLWALALKAGEEWRLGRDAHAAYLFAKVFAECPERRIPAYNDFKAINAPLAAVVKQTTNKREQAFVYALAGLQTPRIGLKALQNVYYTYPKSDMVSILLVREINKIEEGYLTPKINGSQYYGNIGYWEHSSYDSVKRSFINYIPRLKLFCDKVAAEKRYPQPALFNLASAYLSWIQGDDSTGFKSLAAIKSIKLNQKLLDQKELINLLLLSHSIKVIDTAAENKLLPSLRWLDKKVKFERTFKQKSKYWGSYDGKYYSASSRDFYEKVLAKAYLKQKDTAMAAICLLRSQKTIIDKDSRYIPPVGYATPAFWQAELHSSTLKQILKWYGTPNKSGYMNLLMTDVNRTSLPDVYDLLGTAYLREHDYTQAVKAFKHIPLKKLNHSIENAWDTVKIYPSPFVDQLHDYPKTYSSTHNYNKLTYAAEMARLENKLKSNPANAAAIYYKMALGLYNTSYYGNSWEMISYLWSHEDYGRKLTYYYDKDYIKTTNAEKYFLKARSLSKNQEFKARCTFMAAKCRQKQVEFPSYDDYWKKNRKKPHWYEAYDKAANAAAQRTWHNVYFADLKQHYAGTKFYQTAINECSYLRDFLGVHITIKR